MKKNQTWTLNEMLKGSQVRYGNHATSRQSGDKLHLWQDIQKVQAKLDTTAQQREQAKIAIRPPQALGWICKRKGHTIRPNNDALHCFTVKGSDMRTEFRKRSLYISELQTESLKT